MDSRRSENLWLAYDEGDIGLCLFIADATLATQGDCLKRLTACGKDGGRKTKPPDFGPWIF
jgi:hypothetical protein